MPRKQYSYHYIYKTTCKITNKFYIGMHSTFNLEDDYLGSGKRLKYSVNKYGKENHVKEILEFLPDRNSLKLREKEIVNELLLLNLQCMNLALGGDGGRIFKNKEEELKFHIDGAIAVNKIRTNRLIEKIKVDTIFKQKMFAKIAETKFKRTGSKNGWKGKTLTKEHREKISKSNSISRKGEGNSQFGTTWIYNETETKKIKKEDLQSYLDLGWTYGRRKKNKD